MSGIITAFQALLDNATAANVSPHKRLAFVDDAPQEFPTLEQVRQLVGALE